MIQVLVIDDHLAVREGTKAILETDPEIKVECLSPPYDEEALEKVDFHSFDVVLLDLNLGDTNGMELSKGILSDSTCKVILYTGYDVEDYFEEAIKIGIHGAISKTEPTHKIVANIKAALNGEVILSYEYLRSLITKHKGKERTPCETHDLLSEREKAILLEVERGLTNQEIADKLHLSKRSIEYGLTAIFNKLNVGSRTEAVLIAKSEGIID